MRNLYFIFTILPWILFAQIATPYGQVQSTTIPQTGYVGIGTSSPDNLLTLKTNGVLAWEYGAPGSGGYHTITGGGISPMSFSVKPFSNPNAPIFNFNGYSGTKMTILNGGNMGLGTTTPDRLLTLKSGEYLGWEYLSGLASSHTITGGGIAPMSFAVSSFSDHTKPIFSFGGFDGVRLTILNGGNVGIGTTNPQHKLEVTGSSSFSGNMKVDAKIEAKEVKVTTTPTADFVFEESYNLPKLEEVEKHIKEKRHLPEISSAKEMEKEGVNVGEFQIKLLQKIEELTLYIIQQEKRIKELEMNNHKYKR